MAIWPNNSPNSYEWRVTPGPQSALLRSERHGLFRGTPRTELWSSISQLELNQARIATPEEARAVGRDLAQAISRLVLPESNHPSPTRP